MEINELDIHEEPRYFFTCPKCSESTEIDSEPCGGEELQCENCGIEITFNYS